MNHRTHTPLESSLKPRPATSGDDQGFGIEEVTARAGVSERLVRHCEARGLIPGAEKADTSRNCYTHEDVSILRFARRGHVLGFGMNEVAKLLSVWQDMHYVNSEAKSIALAQPKHLESRIDELRAMESVLERLANLISVEHQPTCPILEELMELKLQQINQGLDKRVELRTAQLEAVNRELESFSYSVSHDLQTPLSTITGFSQLLAKSDGDKLSEKGKSYLARISSGANQMGELIEGLLSLAQLSHKKVDVQDVDLSLIARDVAQACCEREPQRKVKVHIQDRLRVHGDPRQLLAVMQNLVGNAWKFSARQAEACIEVGCEASTDGLRYFVKDNGVGFDMTQAQNLFTIFERLHSQHEFSGTGVGLATVQRVVQRHGGRVWAESQTNQGATFYFTLGAIPNNNMPIEIEEG